MKSLLALLVTLGTTLPAFAQVAACSESFMAAILTTATELRTAASFVKAGEDIPNLPEAAMACANLHANHNDVPCSFPGIEAPLSAEPMKKICDSVQALYRDATGEQNPTAVIPAGLVSEKSAVVRLEPSRLSVTVNNAEELQKALVKPRQVSIIGGQVLSTSESLGAEADIRCMLNQPKSASVKLENGMRLQVKSVSEAYSRGFRTSVFSFTATDATIICLNQTERSLALGDLMSAFGSLANVNYQK